jgi:hypothetical protein
MNFRYSDCCSLLYYHHQLENYILWNATSIQKFQKLILRVVYRDTLMDNRHIIIQFE